MLKMMSTQRIDQAILIFLLWRGSNNILLGLWYNEVSYHMREFQQKRKFKRALFSRLSILLLLVVCFVLAKASWNVFSKERESSDKTAQAAFALEALRARETNLSSDIERLSTPQGTEEEIRENFPMAKKGEKLVIFLDNASATQSEDGESTLQQVWQKMKGLFGQ